MDYKKLKDLANEYLANSMKLTKVLENSFEFAPNGLLLNDKDLKNEKYIELRKNINFYIKKSRQINKLIPKNELRKLAKKEN
jgi:hypothetical protein